ncbi:hypothetical protein RhiirC2_774321 [Rhizophagus irregularis]|uniref:Uncharacterized protein n=1 Tax=Rhizophagus irregularis TaxID=588596 RepID=A0A2N1NLT4_9GLOM|nr:hypothetical protein RhiirC2_774321 [Rhizophagus irregularis]
MSSELELLKQRITELEAENAELRKENTVIHDLRIKLSVSSFLEWIRARCLLPKISNCIGTLITIMKLLEICFYVIGIKEEIKIMNEKESKSWGKINGKNRNLGRKTQYHKGEN